MKLLKKFLKPTHSTSQTSEVTDVMIEKAVKNNLKKFSKTYKLLEEYDKNPSQPPKVSPQSEALREYLQRA